VQGSSKVNWDNQWTKGIDKPITWFQAAFDLDHLVKEDLNANPIYLMHKVLVVAMHLLMEMILVFSG